MNQFKRHLPEIIVIVLALLVRLIHLNASFWLDEAAQALESARPLSKQLDIANDFQPPLFHLLVHAFIQISQDETWLRLSSLIPGLITVWLTIKIGDRLFTRNVGLTAGILLATSQFHLFYSQELRPYSLAACLALLAFWGWFDMIRLSKKISWLFLFSSLAGLYTMYLFPVFLLSLLVITFILYRPKFMPLATNYLLLALGFLPWLPSFLEQVNIGTTLASTKPLWSTIVSPPIFKMLPMVYMKFIFGRIPFEPTLISLSLSAIISVWMIIFSNRLRQSKPGHILIYLTFLPVLIGFIISLAVPVLEPKRVLFCLPFLYLLISAGLGTRLRSAIVLVVLLIINMTALSRFASDPDVQREPWRTAVKVLEEQAPDQSLVVFAFDAPFAPWVWYQSRNLATLSLTQATKLPNLSASNVILLDYLRPLYDSADQLPQGIIDQGYQETGFYQYPGIGKMRIYAR